ncbi:MAG: hypothetical protein ABIH11_03670 [Candidatus Altiarchaeota archaeon]
MMETLLQTGDPTIQLYGLIFLLGSLTVASLSDLRRLAAQKDFTEVWIFFTATMLLTDIYLLTTNQTDPLTATAKWTIIIAFASITTTTIHFNISTMDAAAVTALLSLLNPVEITLTLILLLITGELLQPLLKQYGEAGAYPFLPIAWTINILLLAYATTGGPETLAQIIIT